MDLKVLKILFKQNFMTEETVREKADLIQQKVSNPSFYRQFVLIDQPTAFGKRSKQRSLCWQYS
jgi:hypothetical protein